MPPNNNVDYEEEEEEEAPACYFGVCDDELTGDDTTIRAWIRVCNFGRILQCILVYYANIERTWRYWLHYDPR